MGFKTACSRRSEARAREFSNQVREHNLVAATSIRSSELEFGSAKPKATHIFARDTLDFYVEPCDVDDALFRAEPFDGPIFDPACGLGRVVEAAIRAGHHAEGVDIVRRNPLCGPATDFFTDPPIGAANICANPPYSRAREFAELASRTAARKVALLVPYGFLFGCERARWLARTPLRKVWFIVPRPSMPPGELVLAGLKPSGGRVDFVWLVWERGHNGAPEIGWLRK